MNFDLDRKIIFLNAIPNIQFYTKATDDVKDTLVLAFANQAAINACDVMNIVPYARFLNRKIRNLQTARAQTGQIGIQLFKVDQAAGKVAYAVGTTLSVKISISSSNYEAELDQVLEGGRYGKDRVYQITLTTATLAAQANEFVLKLAKAILAEEEYNTSLLGVDLDLGSYNETTFLYTSIGKPTFASILAGTFASADTILIKGVANTYKVDIFVSQDVLATGITKVIKTFAGTSTAVANVAVQDNYEGRNTYEQLRKVKLRTDNNVWAESDQMDSLPINGATYSSFTFDQLIDRPDLGGSAVVNGVTQSLTRYTIYVNEALSTTIGSVTDFLADIIGIWLSTAGSLNTEAHEGLRVSGATVTSATTWDTANIRIS